MAYSVKDFKKQLSYIQDAWLKSAVKATLENAPEYFWTSPASSTGKFHPEWANNPGGLVRHVKSVADLAHHIAEAWGFSTEDHDAAVAAAILHDVFKYGPGPKRPKLSGDPNWQAYRRHAVLGADWVKNHLQPILFDSVKRERKKTFSSVQEFLQWGKSIDVRKLLLVDKICTAIAYHHGRFDKLNLLPLTDIGKAVSTADYLSSVDDVTKIFLRSRKDWKKVLKEIEDD